MNILLFKKTIRITSLLVLFFVGITSVYANGLYLTNKTPPASTFTREMGIVCNNQYGSRAYYIRNGEKQFNEWKLLAFIMDYNRKDYSCDVMLRIYDNYHDHPFAKIGHFEVLIKDDFSGALLKNVSAEPGYRYEIEEGSINATNDDISIIYSE